MKKLFTLFAAMLLTVAVNASTDFAAPGYSCLAKDAVLSGAGSSDTPESNKMYLDESADPKAILWTDVSKSNPAVATWTIESNRACYITVSLALGHKISSNKHIYEVKILDSKKREMGAVEEGPAYTGDGFTDSLTTKVLSGKILIPAAGTYTVELRNNRDYCKGTVEKVILKYDSDAPTTDFSGEGYYCAANDATLSGTAEAGNFYLDKSASPKQIVWKDVDAPSKTAVASWRIVATRSCFVNVKLDLGHKISSNKHIFEVQLWDIEGNKIDTVAEGPAFVGDGNIDSLTVKTITDYLIIPAAGVYTIKVLNNKGWCKGSIRNVILQYRSDIPTIKVKGDLGDIWAEHTAVLAADGQSASYTYENLAKLGDNKEFGIVKNSDFLSNGHRYHRNYTGATGIGVKPDGTGNMKVNVDWAGNYTFTWYFKTNGLEITFPEVPDPIFYVAGSFTNWETNKVAMTEEAGICTTSIALDATTDYTFKILKIDAWGTKTWYGAETSDNHMQYGSCTDWQLTTYNTGNNINLTTTLATEYPFIFNAANAQMSVTIPDPSTTAIDETVAGEKAVKFFRNGQLFIEKDGKTYNVLGTVVK